MWGDVVPGSGGFPLNKTVILVIAAITFIPLAGANHGQTAVGSGSAGADNVAWVARYDGGDGDAQTWLFDVSAGSLTFECMGFGSIEVGFTFDGCSQSFSTGGIEHFHPYLGVPPADAHEVAFTLNGVTGSAQQATIG